MVQKVGMTLLALAITLGIGTLGYAEPILRSNHVPNVGDLAEGEQPLGDMWTFWCPAGGSVAASVDTKNDTDLATSTLDPVLALVDGTGNLLAEGDDENDCTYPPVCGFQCPAVRTKCGSANPHSLIVRDFGAAGAGCIGGGYELKVEVFDASGHQVEASSVALGGGPKRSVPGWALDDGKAPVGPALDDENVPRMSPGLIEKVLNRASSPSVPAPIAPSLPTLP